MKLARIDGGRLAVVVGDEVVDITDLSPVGPDIRPQINDLALFAAFDETVGDIRTAVAERPRQASAAVRFERPVGRPANLIAYPANYHAHREEMSSPNRADRNGFFLKATTSLSGPADPIVLPELTDREIHHECELGIVVGRGGRHLTRGEALEHVLGYCCLIDVTVRGTEERVMRKSFDSFTPIGPWITTADDIDDPDELEMSLSVDGAVRQRANTRDLIVDVRDMLVLASSVMTLNPGDVIATGTPAGVGPLRAGETVHIAIEGVGEMTIPVVAGAGGNNRAFRYHDEPAQASAVGVPAGVPLPAGTPAGAGR